MKQNIFRKNKFQNKKNSYKIYKEIFKLRDERKK